MRPKRAKRNVLMVLRLVDIAKMSESPLLFLCLNDTILTIERKVSTNPMSLSTNPTKRSVSFFVGACDKDFFTFS